MIHGVVAVAIDLVRESLARRWFLALFAFVTLILVTLVFGLSLEVVDGALAATRLFGDDLGTDIVSADVALRPVFQAASYVIFYGGLGFGILACSDFAPGLLSPGRIEHLLSLPIPRAALICGTYLGVMFVIACAALYGAAGFTAILGFKTGVWTPRLLASAGLGALTFSAIYGAMIAAAVFVRSASVSAIFGGSLFVAGIIAGYREDLAPMFEAGLRRGAFEVATLAVPPVSAIADFSARIAGSSDVDLSLLATRIAGILLFGGGALAVGLWRFEQRDF